MKSRPANEDDGKKEFRLVRIKGSEGFRAAAVPRELLAKRFRKMIVCGKRSVGGAVWSRFVID